MSKLTEGVFAKTSMRYPRISTWCDSDVIRETAIITEARVDFEITEARIDFDWSIRSHIQGIMWYENPY